MLTVNKGSLKAKLFCTCLHHPFARGSEKIDGQKPVEWYLEHGTTLCHFFWVCLWLPLFTIAITVLFFGAFSVSLVNAHIQFYHEYGVLGLFFPVGLLLGIIATAALIILAIIGAGKVGLLTYLKVLKERICPMMRFE
jgi:hypothetical protein